MSSNMIKAYSIAYDTKKIKTLDMELRENALEERMRKLGQLIPEDAVQQEESDFVPGLAAENLGDIEPQEEAAAPVITEQDMEAIKNSLREEIMAEMMPMINQKGDDIVNNARAQAEGLLTAAKNEAEIAKESIFKLASGQGYEEGLARAKAEEERIRAELEERQKQLEQQYSEKISELEPAFVNVLAELVKKVTGVAYENHKEVFSYLMETGLGFAQKDTQFDVLLGEEDYKKYSPLFPKIKEHYKEKFILEFKKADLPEGSCKLENEHRVIDCGLGIRLNGLLEELSLLGV